MKKEILIISLFILVVIISGCEEDIVGKRITGIDEKNEIAEPSIEQIKKETIQESEKVKIIPEEKIEPIKEELVIEPNKTNITRPIDVTKPIISGCERAEGICTSSCPKGYIENPDLTPSCNLINRTLEKTDVVTASMTVFAIRNIEKQKCCVPYIEEIDGYLDIATLKTKYALNEQVNLTDPPLVTGNIVKDTIQKFKNIFNRILKKESVAKYIERDTIDSQKFVEYQIIEPFVEPKGLDKEITLPTGTVTEIKPQKIFGYIIQFKEEPIVTKKIELEKTFKKGQITKTQLETQLNSYKNEVLDLHNKAKQDIQNLFPNKKILNEFYIIYNGLAIDASEQEIEKIKKLSYVKAIYPNYEVQALLNESVPLINADDVWKLQDSLGRNITGQNVSIAIIDTGVDYTHEDLGGCYGGDKLHRRRKGCKVIDGWDFFNDDADPMDDHGHGTHVAATAAGTGQASSGILKGVAPDAKLYAYKVLDSSGSGSISDVIAGIERSVDPNQDGNTLDHVDIISMSLGRDGGSPDEPDAQAVDNAVDAGVVAVIAAGNAGPEYGTIGCPGCARKAITVGATDKNDVIAYFSSRGPTSILTVKPDVVAPGVNICASQYDDWLNDRQCFDDKHIAISGTSMATPHVAGAVALLLQKNPDWNPIEIKMALRNTAIDIGEDILTQGYGRIDVLSAANIGNPPPVVILNPVSVLVGSVANISGSVLGEFGSWSLSYCLIEPSTYECASTWIDICNGQHIVDDNFLCSWNIGGLDDGKYYLKLIVQSYPYPSVDYLITEINNVDINITKYHEFISGIEYNITGTAYSDSLSYYILDYAKIKYDDFNNNQWEVVSDFTQIAFSSEPIVNDILGVLSLTDYEDDDSYYLLRLRLYSNNFLLSSQKVVYIEQTEGIQNGWPIELTSFGTLSSINIADLDGDSLLENSFSNNIFSWNSDAEFYVWDSLGNVLPGWPVGFDLYPGSYSSPAIGDINNDGYKEIVITNGERLYIFNRFGERVGFYYTNAGGDFNPSLIDINNDGYLEIVYGSAEPKINVFNHLGEYFDGYPLYLDEPSYPDGGGIFGHSVGDLDGNGEVDIIFGTRAGKLYAYNLVNQELLPGFPILLEGYSSTPIIADIDCNGDNEIIAAVDNYPVQKMFVWNHDGNLYPGWPRDAYAVSRFDSIPAVGDIDDDCNLEIFYTTYRFKMFGWHHDGTSVNGWPKEIAGAYTFTQPILSDITGDGSIDIITQSHSDYRFILYAFHNNGTLINGFPKQLLDFGCIMYYSSPAVGDMDNDGDIELFAHSMNNLDCSGYFGDKLVYKVWDLDAPYNPSTMEWPMFQHNPQHTGNYNYRPLRPKSLINNTGNTTISGYLLMKVQKKVKYVEDPKAIERGVVGWQDVEIVVNDLLTNNTRTILPHTHLALDTIWYENGAYTTTEKGNFRVYAALLDINGNIIRTRQGLLENWYEFKVSSIVRPDERAFD